MEMRRKIKDLFKPDFHEIIQGIYTNIVWFVFGFLVLAVGGIWYWISRLDPLEWKVRLSQVVATLLYLLTALGAGTILYSLWRLWIQFHPTTFEIFSYHLDKITRGKNITGLGRMFLRSVKKAPPFLGIPSEKPILLPVHEKALTEYFQALDFVNKNKNIIRGGTSYQIKRDDTWDMIAEKIYGDVKFIRQLQAANPGFYTLSQGVYITLPYIDVSESLGMAPNLIEMKYDIAHDKDKLTRGTFMLLMNQLHLVYDETLELLRWVYDAAQLTLNDVK